MKYAADFETTADPDDCRVWAWGLAEIGNPDNFQAGNDLDQFFDFFEKKTNNHVYFHNLKFDGEFILAWLFRHGYEAVASKKDLYTRSFCTVISDQGQWYAITVCFRNSMKRSRYLYIYDSLKVLPFSVDQVARTFKLPVSKLSIDYTKHRDQRHVLTEAEREYLKADVTIMALALAQLFKEDLTKMTIGSNALKDFIQLFDQERFKKLFPVIECDSDIRRSYKGGFTWLKPEYRGKVTGAGQVFDVNSLYPFVMAHYPMPYDHPIYYEGKYEPDELYPLYVQMISCNLKLKKEHVPSIQLKKNRYFYGQGEYITDTYQEDVTLTLTSVDMALMFEQYQVTDIEYIGGYKFKAARGLFADYIEKWSHNKIQAKRDGNAGLYTISKLMLNSLYGKFSLNPEVKSKYPAYDSQADMVQLLTGEAELRKPIYIPVGTFITSYARAYTIRAAQKLYDRFIYADTDSLHITGQEPVTCLDIDPVQLGAWKHELTFTKAKYIRSKAYIEIGHEPGSAEPDRMRITCAGLPERCHSQVTFDNFKVGAVYHDNLLPSRVPGGVVLLPTHYKIKEL